MKKSISALILTGGKSSRMGIDKATLQVEGETFLSRTCRLAQNCTQAVYAIAPDIEQYQQLVPATCHLLSEKDCSGPLMAFYRGLIAIKTEWVLLLACDLPYLNEAELREWIKYIDKVPPTAIALVPKSDRGWEPLAAFYRTNCLSLLKDFIARGDRSFQIWLSENQVMELPIRDRHILFNCNNPEDLATLS